MYTYIKLKCADQGLLQNWKYILWDSKLSYLLTQMTHVYSTMSLTILMTEE